VVSYLPFLSLFCTIDALTAANARIASLEAELDASRKAWDVATTAKVAAEKTAKSAETKVKKAEKALVTADQKRAQRDQTVTECLDKISALLGGDRRVVYFLLLFFSCS
jgi:septal ring factor EnvC (AmiA/AmiB activator)